MANDILFANTKFFRQQASKLASKANKRIKRLEKNNLTSSPAYKKLVENGEPRFGVRGKTNAELKREVARMNKFLDSKTSTVRGLNSTLKEMANNTGMKYKNFKDLQKKADKFFELADKVEQYLRSVDDIASAIGYQKIWEVISEYTEAEGIDLADGEVDIEQMTEMVSGLLEQETDGKFTEFDGTDDWIILD